MKNVDDEWSFYEAMYIIINCIIEQILVNLIKINECPLSQQNSIQLEAKTAAVPIKITRLANGRTLIIHYAIKLF